MSEASGPTNDPAQLFLANQRLVPFIVNRYFRPDTRSSVMRWIRRDGSRCGRPVCPMTLERFLGLRRHCNPAPDRRLAHGNQGREGAGYALRAPG